MDLDRLTAEMGWVRRLAGAIVRDGATADDARDRTRRCASADQVRSARAVDLQPVGLEEALEKALRTALPNAKRDDEVATATEVELSIRRVAGSRIVWHRRLRCTEH